MNKVRCLLEREIKRLKAKTQSEDVMTRRALIAESITQLTSDGDKINYTQLYEQLSALQDQLSKVKRRKCIPLFFQTKSHSVKEIAHIKLVIAPNIKR